ncbi:extracellular solute-binding protein [Microvirga lotononidis]|uniref:ABC-type Fe3+ transport system, periplasmic component n=2 Tax=Microvirga lotononidis TaxID=864069 RepID=I4YRM6_9HYPH|nr:ABC-type Fe3+ transport system, periplasmic component [Microvirga lotononidis]
MVNVKSVAVAATVLVGIAAFGQVRAEDLVVYTSHGEVTSGPVLDAFKKARPDINVTVVRGGTGEVLERLRAEAGNPTADILWGGPTQSFDESAALFQSYESQADSVMVAADPNHKWHAYTVLLQPVIVSRKRVQAEDMPKTQKDLANPKWASLGSLIIPDPSKSGTGYTILSALAGANGWDFIAALAKGAKISPGSDDAFNAVRDGEAAVGWINEDLGAKWKAAGLPIEIVYTTDAVTGQIDAQAIVKGAPHLKAAQAFIDFLGTKESHEIVRDATIRRSARQDVVPPTQLPDIGKLNIVSPVDPRPVVTARFQEAIRR